MNHQSAIIAMLAILSIAALVAFTVQVADAQLPFLSVGTDGVRFQTEEFDLSAEATGVQFFTDEFGLIADGSGVNIRPPPS
jgi:hypothetical protein